MASFVALLLVLELATLSLCNHCPETTGFCSQVYQMQRICSGLSPVSPTVIYKRGKPGLPGRKGDPGNPASVDYDAIYEKIATKFQEMESRIDAKFAKFEQLIEKKINKTERLNWECRDMKRDDALSWDGKGGIFNIYRNEKKLEVYCDLTTDGGGWLVIQRRIDGSSDFQKNWDEYVSGFGDKNKEFWLGLEIIHQLVHGGDYELRIDLSDWAGESAYAKYRSFSVGDASTKYRLNFGSYSGNAGNALNYHNNRKFSTNDQDNDDSGVNCAAVHGGGWWFGACDSANLNGIYHAGGFYGGNDDGIEWNDWDHGRQYSMKTTEMKLRLIT